MGRNLWISTVTFGTAKACMLFGKVPGGVVFFSHAGFAWSASLMQF